MHSGASQKKWEEYVLEEMAAVRPILEKHSIELDEEQPHVIGERAVMRAVTTQSGEKLVLVGHMSPPGIQVIVKTTSDARGRKELEHEKKAKALLTKLRFAYDVFFTPKELIFVTSGGRSVAIYEFIEQEKPFTDRPLEEQFRFALNAFKAQESAHATTAKHTRLIKGVFDTYNAADYCDRFQEFKKTILEFDPSYENLLAEVQNQLESDRETIDRYGRFLVHTDFVPHNFRIKGDVFYLLDFSSLRFGNKYEGWARFLNFMTLYNPSLEDALTQYVARNRSSGEQESLRLMRFYRLAELAAFYVGTLPRADDALKTLNAARVSFWLLVLETILKGQALPESIRSEYQRLRDSLRSDDEKQRQKGLH